MSQESHFGQFDANSTYSHKSIARILGVTDRWVLERMIQQEDGLHHRRVGKFYFVSGKHLQYWIEGGAGPCDES